VGYAVGDTEELESGANDEATPIAADVDVELAVVEEVSLTVVTLAAGTSVEESVETVVVVDGNVILTTVEGSTDFVCVEDVDKEDEGD